MVTHHDIIIIGAGPGGYETALAAAKAGKRVLIIEKSELGGTCLNCGCIPTKALRHTALVYQQCRQAASAGVDCTGVALDFPRAMQRKDEVVQKLREGIQTLLGDVDVIRGEASFTPQGYVEVNGEVYHAPQIIIATGSRPATLNIEGAELALDSTAMLSLADLPASLAIIGGGVIGMEFASIFNTLGSEVTVIEWAPEIIPGMDADIAKRLRMLLKRRGINFILGARVENISSLGSGRTVSYTAKGKTATVNTEKVLMAVGRRPVLPEGISNLQLSYNNGFIAVDPDTMATQVPGIYAIGDVNGLCLLAHAAHAQGLRAIGISQPLDVIPSVAFTIPECAMAGITSSEAERRGINTRIGTAFYRANGKAVAEETEEGMLRITVDADTDRIIGCHGFGHEVSMIVQEVATAMSLGASATRLLHSIRSHPTVSEIITDALRALR